MRLTRLELKGFKSFKDKTVLEFPDKFTGIVGPNGSGKSNITEAICFVLGKSRGLRAANLQELIFNGGLAGEPSNKAVVAITLKDDKGVPHRITRVVDRMGNSLYKLNDKKITRQQIMDLVGDSEYNIILQDDITKVVEMKSKDRRKIIDDLCGIGVYDEKRDKALRELEKVEERISQTHIILGEKQGYMHSLRKERDEALKYTKARDDLRSARATLLSKEIVSFERRGEKVDELVGEITKGRQEALGRIAGAKSDIQKKNERLRQISSELIRLEDEKKGTKITEVRGEILRHEDKIALLSKQNEALEAEETDKKQKASVLLAQKRQFEGSHTECDARHSSIVKEIEYESSKPVDAALETEIDHVKNTIYEARSRIKALVDHNAKRRSEKGALETERDGLEEKMKAGASEEANGLKEVEKCEMEYNKYSEDYKRFETEYSQANEEINSTRQRLEEQRITFTQKESELQTVLRASGGMQQAVRTVLSLKKVIPGIFGAVMQLGEVKDERYATALRIAAGNRTQYVVVASVGDASKCIDYLREKKVGRCTFLPLDKINIKPKDKAPSESLGFARDYLSYSEKFAKVFEYVFQDTIIVKDIEAAKRIGIGEWRMITLDGDLLELSGAITGGHVGDRAEITFNNIDDLEKEIVALQSGVRSLEAEYGEKVAARKRLDQTLMLLKERLRAGRESLDGARLKDNISSERRARLRESLDRVVQYVLNIDKDVQENSLESTNLEKSAGAEEKKLRELAERRGQGKNTKLDSLKDTLRDLEVQKTRLAEQINSINREQETLKARMAEIAAVKDGIAAEVGGLQEKIRHLRSELGSLERAHESVGGEINKLIAERGQVEVDLTNISAKIGETERGMEGAAAQLQEYTIEKAKISTRLEDLRREYSKYEGVGFMDKSVKDLEDMAVKLEQDLTAFGSVNLRSIETFEVIKKEFDEITAKLETLKKERQSIFDFMDKIESKKRDVFMEAFDKVKANFERIYAQLADGRGTLTLDNPMNISESGLIISASPGGKRVMSLDAMSGGEKVLTSSAFLLALQQYKPAYFYVVDELDAALDKRNSVRLAQLLAANTSQFLMVTHNNNMLQYMDSAIGVSMIKGASQIVGVRFGGENQAPLEAPLPGKEQTSPDLDSDEPGDMTPPEEGQAS